MRRARHRARSRWLLLPGMAAGTGTALLGARLVTGAFLVDGVWDNVSSAARMAEFARFLAAHGFPVPALAAPFSIWTQLLAGIGLVLGLLTRWAGLIVTVTFAIGWWTVHSAQPLREQWPALALVALGLVFLTAGGGRFSLDRLLERA